MNTIVDTTPRSAARIAGLGSVAIFVLAIFANFFVREGLIDTSDPLATVANVTGSEGLFRAGLAAFVVIFLLDVPVAWALYAVFKVAGQTGSLLAAWFRIVYTVSGLDDSPIRPGAPLPGGAPLSASTALS